ncbi:MAG TPA: hypothetical protein VHU14_09615 [Solirubrobacterales bacterium]|jgi:hypothetical protein|nr:hypothetical protein [Solirubrobacterales bacterium]
MNDDWRLQVDFHDPGHARPLVGELTARELVHDLSDAFHDRVIVSRDGARVFLYAGSREQAERSRELILSLAEQHGWKADVDLKHWHPAAEDWEDPDKPLPATDAAKLAEHEVLMAAERKQTEERGYPEFEVRVDLPSRHDALRFAERLRGEGLPTVHRWRFLLVGATDEDSARALAERIQDEAPSGSQVKVEGTWKAVYAERSRNPYAVFGGLGG